MCSSFYNVDLLLSLQLEENVVRKHAHPSSGSNHTINSINNNNNNNNNTNNNNNINHNNTSNHSNQVKKCVPALPSNNNNNSILSNNSNLSRHQHLQTASKRKRSEERDGVVKKPKDEEDTAKKLQETEEALRSLSGAGLFLQSNGDDPADTPFVNLFEKEAHADKPPSAVASAWKDVVSVSSCSSNGSAPSPALNIVTSPRLDLSCVKQEPPSTPQASAVSSL